MKPLHQLLCATVAFACAVSFAQAADAPAARSRPNILFLVSDDQRPDTIAALGNAHIRTPNLDRLVRQGVAFTRAICPNPLCVTSRAEILTGCTSFLNGVPYGGRLRPDMPMIAETFRQAGYHTWHVGKWHVQGEPKTRGYEETRGLYSGGGGKFENTLKQDHAGREVTGYRGWTIKTPDGKPDLKKGVGLTADISRHFADATIELLNRKTPEPFFLHVNFTAPHDPLIMPPGCADRYDPAKIPLPANFQPEHPFEHGNARGRDELLWPWPRTAQMVREEMACYYAVISHMDEQIGRILDALRANGQADNTIIIFTSDQGLAIGSHGLRGKQNMYEHTVGVPLLLSGPGIARDRRCAVQCYQRDLFPTLCELAGVKVPQAVQGKSLVPILKGDRASLYPHVVGYFGNVQRMIRADRWKLIWYPQINKYQLFDLANDPNEMKDLSSAPEHTAVVADLRAKLEAWLKENRDPLFVLPDVQGQARKPKSGG
ncbi:MAG: DUF4976 domain-containing protein [Verrucomicrobia bacterium]|nr:DUF4976 domain-containing protein [Verrucomicrobiota bacterium]